MYRHWARAGAPLDFQTAICLKVAFALRAAAARGADIAGCVDQCDNCCGERTVALALLRFSTIGVGWAMRLGVTLLVLLAAGGWNSPSALAQATLAPTPPRGTAADRVDLPAATAAVLDARAPSDVSDLRLIQAQLQRVIGRALPATVSVEIGRAAGSGVIVSREGLVLTAAHVIGRPGRRAVVQLPDGRKLRGRTLGANHDADAGMIQLDEPPADLPFAPVSADRDLEVGEWVVTTGQPGGIVSDRAPPVRLGRVLVVLDDMVCTDCKLVGGDSGGPLFNMRGEVVGIHSSIGPMITHNFHVPMTSFHAGWDRLLAGELWGGRFDELAQGRPMIGVSGRTEEGECLITQVFPGLPADEAGVQVGDRVAAVDGRPIDSFEELARRVARRRPGEQMELTIDRQGLLIDVEVSLAGVRGGEPPSDEGGEDP